MEGRGGRERREGEEGRRGGKERREGQEGRRKMRKRKEGEEGGRERGRGWEKAVRGKKSDCTDLLFQRPLKLIIENFSNIPV